MSYNEEDLAFQQRVRGVLEQKALLGGRRRSRKSSRRRKHSKKGGILSGGLSGGVLTGGRRRRKRSSKRKCGYGTLSGGSTAAQKRAAAHARAAKKSKHSRKKRVRFGRGYEEPPMEGGYRRKRRSRRRMGGALTKEEIDLLLKDPTVGLARDVTEIDRLRTRNPAQDLDAVYTDVVTDLQIKQDQTSLNIMRKIQELQNELDFQSMKFTQDAERVAEAFAQAKLSEEEAYNKSRYLLNQANNKVAAAKKSYSKIRELSKDGNSLVPIPQYYTSAGTPVFEVLSGVQPTAYLGHLTETGRQPGTPSYKEYSTVRALPPYLRAETIRKIRDEE